MSEPAGESVLLEIRYGHPSGAVQASHPETGLKQLGDSPGEAVEELWSMLETSEAIVSKADAESAAVPEDDS